MKPALAALLVILLLASVAVVLVAQPRDPLAPYRAADGSLHIPGQAFTPELQQLLFGGNNLQPLLNLTYYAPARSSYATANLVARPYLTPNPNVFVHPGRPPTTLADGIAHIAARWFPPIDWGAAFQRVAGWFFGLFTWDARAAVTVDTTTVTDIPAPANTCTTSQTTGATDNAVLVLLSERGTTTFLSVTYGSASLTLIASTAANGGTFVRTEIWGFAGTLPVGVQTMTATLSGGSTAKMTCATVLLQGVKATGSFIDGTSNAANSTNATVSLTSAIAIGNLGFAVASIQNTGAGAQPTAVAGTGATATDLYGVAVGHCTGSGASNECAAGADLPNPGTAVTWTNVSTQWVVSAVEVVAIPTCATVGGGNCYRINNGGTWTNVNNWSNTAGGPSCSCTPLSTDFAIFNATPTGTTSLAGATTIAGLDMTGFTGTLDTTNANNWPLTVNGNFTIQGTFLPRGSTVTVTGNVTIVGAGTVVTMSSSSWTVNGTWTNNSTSATWSAGTSSVTIKDATSGTLTFASLGGGANEFNNLTLDASVAAGLTYSMATNGLRIAGTLLLQNTTAGATGETILDTSGSNLAITSGALTVATWGALNSEASTITINGNVNISATSGYVTNTGGAWTVTGSWRDTSTSASWSFAAAIVFRSAASQTMTFGPQAGNEFAGAVTFDTSTAAGITYTMATNPLGAGGALTVQNTAGGATGPVVLDTSAGNLAVTGGGLTESALGAFATRTSTVTINGDVTIGAGSAYVTSTGGSWTVTGAWTDRTASGSWSFAAAMTFRASASKSMIFTGSNLAGNEFSSAVTFDTTAAAGVTYTMAANTTGDSSFRTGGALTIRNTAGGATAATILDTSVGNYGVNAGSLTLGTPRGALKSEGSTITINGAVSVSDANSYLVLGSATWTVAGAWTNNSTDGADWSAGTGTLTFRAAANPTMTFANLGANEANHVVFDTTTAAGITYTMATNALRIAGNLTVQNTAATPTGNVVLTTSATNLAITSTGMVLGTRGTLTANGSTITVNGSWTSTAANHVWNKGTSTVVFGASGTLTMSAGESFNVMTQSAGTTTLGSNVTVSGATTVNGALDTSASNFTLTLQSTLSIGASGVLNLEASTASTSGNVTIAAGGAVRFTGAASWTINGSWTDNNTTVPASWAVATSTVRIADGAGATLTFWTAAGNEFNNLTLDSSVAAGFTYGQVNALQAAGTLTVQNTAGSATGAVIFDATASNFASTLGGLSLEPLGAYTSRSASVTVNGNVSLAASGYITNVAAGTWTVTGSWSNGTTSGSWSFLAPITFRSAASQTMTFKASGTEFGGAVTFDTTTAAGVTYTMATNGLTLSGLLTVRNTVASPTGNTILDTSGSNLGITAGSVTLGTNGTLRANGSTISVGGNWTVTAVNATFTAGTSTVVFTAATTINMTQAFNNMTVSAGSATLASNLTANAAVTVSGGLLAKGTFTLSAGAVTLSGGALTSTSGAGTVAGNVSITAAASYISFGSETWTIGGTWTNSSTSVSWSAGTGTIVFNDGSSATMTFAGTNLSGNEFNNVTFDTTVAGGVTYTLTARGLRIGGALLIRNSTATPTGNTILDTSASGLAVTAGSLTLGVSGTLTANGSLVTLSGNWTSTAAGATFNANTSTVTIVAAAALTLGSSQSFNVLTITAGTATLGSQLTAATVNINGGTLAKSTNTLTVNGNLTLGGGALTSTSGAATVTGTVTISAAASYIAFGSETWTVSGTWTNGSTSASWAAGTGTVVFSPGASGTYTFGNLSVNEFNNLQITPTGAATLTLATNALRWGGSLTINNNATLATGNLSLTGGSLVVGDGGTLTANASTVNITNVSMTGGTSGTIILTTGSWTVSGNWDTSGAGSTITQGTSSVTLSGASKTVRLLAGQQFATLIVSGTVSLASDLAAKSITVSGTLTKTGFNLTFNALTATTGTVVDGTVNVTSFTVTDSDPAAAITISVFSVWTANTQYGWTHTDSMTTDTITFTIGGQTGLVFNVYKDGAWFKDGTISAGNITFTMLGSDPTVLVTPSACAGNNRYWVLGTGSWSQTGHWASSSGGVEGCSVPGAAANVFFDASSGSGTSTVDANASITALNTTGSTIGTIGIGTFNLGVSGNVTLAAGTITVGASAGTGLAITGTLTLSGSAVLDGSGVASVVSVTGNVNVASATAYMRLGSGTWTFSGSWTNSSTSASWSPGTGTVLFKENANATMTFGNLPGSEFNNLTFDTTVAAGVTYTMAANSLDLAGILLIQNSTGTPTGSVALATAGLALSSGGVTVGVRGTLSAGASTITVGGGWTVTAANATFTAGTSTVVLTAAGTVSMTQAFYNLSMSAGAVTAGTNLTASNALTIAGGTLVKGTATLSAGSLTLSGGALTSTSGNVTISGNVSVSSAASYIAFGSEAWTVSGSWTNASTSASWAPGTGTITFNAASAQSMSFAGSNLGGNEFNNVTFNSGAVAVTFTMAARGLSLAGTLTVGGGAAVTALDTSASNLAISAVGLTVSTNGSLRANGSTITVTSFDTHLGAFAPGTSTVVVNASGGSVNVPQTLNSLTVNPSVSTTFASAIAWSGTLTLTGVTATFASDLTSSGAATLTFGSATLSVAGNWDTSSAVSFLSTGSTVSFTGAAKTIILGGSQNLAAVTVSGTYALGGPLAANGPLTVSGTLDTTVSNYGLTAAGGLTVSGATAVLRSNASVVAVTGNVTVNNASGYITASGGGAWTVTSGSWTNASTSASWSFAGSITFRSVVSQTLSFGNLAQEFGGSVTLDSSVAAGVTYTMAANGLRVGGTLTIQNTTASPTGNTVLTTSGSSLAIAAATLALSATGTLTANASTITVTFVDTHLGTFNVGTSTLVVSASGGAINVPQTVNNLTVNPGISTTFGGSLTWSGTLTLTSATVAFGASSLSSSGAATMTFGSATITMSTGSWSTSSATTFVATGSSVTFSGTGSLNAGPSASFGILTVAGGTRTLLGPLTTTGLLTLSGGVLAKGTNALTANAGLTLSGGALTSSSGDVGITGNAAISASSYISFGSETWTVTGSWTDNSTSASWSAGTATVVFASASSRTMTFAALPAAAPEFFNVTFNGGASTVTFTMAANALVWSGLLTVQGGSGTTSLLTANLGLNGGALSVGNAGILTANASTVVASGVSMNGGASGIITITTGLWTVSGNWDTSGAGSTLTAGTSTVTFTGASAMVRLAAGHAFYDVLIAGTVSTASAMTVLANLTLANGAVLTKTGQNLTFNGLSEVGNGAIVDGTVTVVNFTVTNSDATNLTTISLFSAWASDGESRWTDSSTVGTSILTFTIGGNTSGYRFNVTKDGAAFTTGIVDASGQVVFTMLGSDPVVDVIIALPCGGTRYWVGGAGAWSDSAHWSATSGGVGGCPVPNGGSTVLFDANSGGATVTVDQNAALASLDMTGSTGTIALGTFNFSVGGNLLLAGGILTVGASAGTGLSINGNLVVSGSAGLDGSGAASLVSVAGNASITSTAAFVRMGSGTWTFAGSWANASTSAMWAAGTGTVVFDSATSQAMTFGAFAGKEFYNVTFASTAIGGVVTFTVGTNSLRWAGLLTVQDAGASTTALSTSSLSLSGGSLSVGNRGILTAAGSTVTLADVMMTGGTSGTISVTTGAWTVSGNWDTSGVGSIYTRGTGSVMMSGASKTLKILNATSGFSNLTITGAITLASALDVSGALVINGTLTTAGYDLTGGAGLVLSGGGALNATSSALTLSSVTMNDAAANTFSLTTGSVTVTGSWDTSGASSTLDSGTSTVTLATATGTIALGASQAFAALVLSGAYSQSTQLSAASLTIASGGLTKGTNALTINGDLNLSGGYLTSVSGTGTIAGNVSIAASSYIAFGSESWTISGSWTNNSISSSWSAGTGSVTFDGGTSETMAFAGSNLSGIEFYAVIFNGGPAMVTFTLAGSALRAHAVTVQGGTGTTTLSTSGANVPITVDSLTVAAGGALLANGSVLTVRSMDTSAGSFTAGTSTVVVSASGGTIRVPQLLFSLTVNAGLTTTFGSNVTWSSLLTLTGTTVTFAGNLISSGPATISIVSATISIAGSWDTSSALDFSSSSSTVTFAGPGQTVTLGTVQAFATAIIAGAVGLASDLTASTLTINASATLTKTNHSISFNALSVGGTIADGSVSVSNLTVANSDATALVTISVFAAWNTGSEYAWTHSSSETSQAITWTIGGNTSRFLYHVTKDGTDFANGTVNDSGNLVFTMIGSDPVMRVVVSPPPVPAWWQSPYFLAIPPIGFLVVIGMFVQRRRWRPAKAFLVDERGQLLREFTLDPSCQVTYDQAFQAGALDAVDKDVRVSKYHARAVRGDMLSVIMLAVGPANIEEVEFARGLLVSIQDKLEDSTKQRVDEARAEETSLDSLRAQAEEERADLQARARVFGDMVNAFTIARGKLDTDSQKLRKLDTNLREREGNLAEVRAALEEQAAQVEAKQTGLDTLAADLESRQAEIQETEKTLQTREETLAPMEKDLAHRLEEVGKKDSELSEREATLAASQAQLTADLEDHHAKVEQAATLQSELAEERKSLDDLTIQIDQEEESLKEKTSAIEDRERKTAAMAEALKSKLADLEPREQKLQASEAGASARETTLAQKEDALTNREKELHAQLDDLHVREAALATRAQDLKDERKALDDLTREAVEERKSLEAKAAALLEQESDVAKRTQDLTGLKENLGPREAALVQKEDALAAREKALASERTAFKTQQELVAAKALEIEQQMEQLKEREVALAQEKVLLQDAKGAFDAEIKDLEAMKTAFAQEMQRQEADAEAQSRTLGEARMRLTKDSETFEAKQLEKDQWIASKEIELEAKEQGLGDREAEVRAQAEDNAQRLSELAAREETLEIDADKLEKARAEAEIRKAELAALARDLDTRSAKLQAEEAQKGEELRTWQATLESEQALLKEQRETFDKEMQDLRESWAGRMIRVEQHEEELKEREAKVQSDIEWVGRNESEISKREKAAAENLGAANELKAEGERLRAEVEQRAMEVESRERALREEAAQRSVDLEKRMETIQTQEAELAGRKAQWERELATQTQKLNQREAELVTRNKDLDAHGGDLASRENALRKEQATFRQAEDRFAREQADLQATEKQLEARQVELTQTRERLDAESIRLRTETDAVRQSLASKEADLTSERERLERESSALQDKLGTKAKEMAAREKAVAAREEELRSEEQDLDARTRELDSRERQAEARLAELAPREKALAQNEMDQKARRTAFDETVTKFESEAAARQQEWKDLQTTLRSQEAQLAASTETRQAEIRKRMEELEQRERSANATLTQAQIERTRLEAQAKAQSAKEAEIQATGARADKRFAELKAMEEDLLKARQAFESEKSGWSSRRNEELKQLEATRDAAAEQTQQAERLIEDSQRRAYVAVEAEKAAKRQGEELAAARGGFEKRRADAEKAEKDLESQMAQLREASQRLGSKELELNSRTKELDALQARVAEADKKGVEMADGLKARKASLDQESERIAALAAQLDKRQAEIDSRHGAVESKLSEVTKREQVLSTELQRADNLMEDLNRKEAEIRTREKGFSDRELELAKREGILAQRDSELRDGMQTLERLQREHEARAAQTGEDHRRASEARKEAEGIRSEAEKFKAQADAMQAEVAKNMRFLQKKALDVLDREEKIRAREVKIDEQSRLLESRAQILEQKDRAFDAEKDEMTARLDKIKQDNEKLKAKLAEAEKAGKSTIDMDEWKRDIENRVKIIQKKALDLLDREEKLRKKEEELRELAAKLGVEAKS